jgi:uncharacterized protein YggT (Ycf19 family)
MKMAGTMTHPHYTPPLSLTEIALMLNRLIDYVFGIVYGLTLFRFGLEFFGANEFNLFKRTLDRLTDPFVGPFLGLFDDPASPRTSLFLSYFIAFCVFAFVQTAIRGLLRLFWRR